MEQSYSDWPSGTKLPVVGARFDLVEDVLPGQGNFYVGRLGKLVATRHEEVEVNGEQVARLWFEAA